MADADCIELLQWALPRLGMRWAGFRKVRGQVCKRLGRRVNELGLDGLAAYRTRLEADPQEWRVLDACCHITISRFFRDRGVFETLRRTVLPEIAERARREARVAHCWSAGCASGEEPYTVKIIWDVEAGAGLPRDSLSIVATDIDDTMLGRAREGCFEAASLRELPPPFIAEAFERTADRFCVRAHHRPGLVFDFQDLRSDAPTGPFDLVLCRYVAFTYFAPPLQRQVLTQLVERLVHGGYLVIGSHEQLPEPDPRLIALVGTPQIFRRSAAGRC